MLSNQVFITQGIQHLLECNTITHEQIAKLLLRHNNKDYGDVEQDSIDINNETIRNKLGTVLSSYHINNIKIWVITTMNSGENYTTVLLPQEY